MTDQNQPGWFGRRARIGTAALGAVVAIAGIGMAISETPAKAREQRPANAVSRASAPIADLPGRRMGFVVTSFYNAMYQGKDACPTGMNKIPTSQEFLASKAPEERARLLIPANTPELYRLMNSGGPNGENLCDAPWAVRDAPLTILSGDRNDGLDLDGWKGTGAPPASICRQKQYIGEDGDTGIDNQLGRIYACLNGVREKGTLVPYFTQTMRAGMWSMLIDVSGVQDNRNDPEVVVDVYAGAEPMARDSGGNVLTNASLSPLTDPKFHRRMRGRITNGVLKTAPIADMFIPDIMAKNLAPWEIVQPRFQLTLQSDGNAKGLLGGYRTISSIFRSGESSSAPMSYVGYQCEGMYHALRKFADGNRDPQTGTCDQISAAFRIEAIPAFIVHPERRTAPSFSDARQ